MWDVNLPGCKRVNPPVRTASGSSTSGQDSNVQAGLGALGGVGCKSNLDPEKSEYPALKLTH